MTQAQGRQLLILAAKADYLARLREARRISPQDYLALLNQLRAQAGMDAVTAAAPAKPEFVRMPDWETS